MPIAQVPSGVGLDEGTQELAELEAAALDPGLGGAERAFHNRGHLFLGEAAGSSDVGVRRIQVPAGGWSTPAHEHGNEEEIFYVLAGEGVSWQNGRTTSIGPGDCVVYLALRGAHSIRAVQDLDVLAFGPRYRDEF